MKKHILLVLLSLFLAACGGGGGSDNTQNNTPSVNITISPTQTDLYENSEFQFNASVTGSSNAAVTWSVGQGGGTISNTGLYKAPSIAGSYQVTATSQADTAKSASATVTVRIVELTATNENYEALAGQAIQLDVKVTGTSNTGVVWSLPETNSGSISQSGLYKAPPKEGLYDVIATSNADPRKSIIIQVNVQPPVTDTAYQNFKQVGIEPSNLPIPGDARAYIDFNNDGILDLVIADLTYWGMPFESSTPAKINTWLGQSDGSWLATTDYLPATLDCLHPRKVLTADFNKDGTKDLAFICHGYDMTPFPGEKNQLFLSSPTGYVAQVLSDDIGFFHSGSTADVNFDGFQDILLVNPFDKTSPVYFMVNNGNGTFTKSYEYLPTTLAGKNYFSAELVDITQDSLPDLIIGGHDWEGADTLIYENMGDYQFDTVTPIGIPAVANEGVVLDFTVTVDDSQVNIWVNRTSGGDGTFYQSLTVQKFSWPQRESEVVFTERPKNWTPWLIPAVVNGENVITTDRASDNLLIIR
jgi:hypothetical protein